jgi:5'-3' exoribonuclease 1
MVAKIVDRYRAEEQFMPSFIVAKQLGLNALVLSRVTSSLHVFCRETEQRYNLGLNLKYGNRDLKVAGYSEKNDRGWMFSNKAISLLQKYMVSSSFLLWLFVFLISKL